MNEKQAIEELLFQSGRHIDIENPRWVNGFLGMLRPFQGSLIEEKFHKIVGSLYVLADFFSQENIKNEIISSIWGICHLGRDWAVNPKGMLQLNNLISDKQIKEIENWIEHISYITFCLLDGSGTNTAFEFYETEYKKI